MLNFQKIKKKIDNLMKFLEKFTQGGHKFPEIF